MKTYTLVTVFFGYTTLLLKVFFLSGVLTTAIAANHSKSYVVVLDPGHGGRDVGSVGTRKYTRAGKKKAILEKNVTLNLALRTARYLKLKKFWGPLGRPIKVVFTRTSDQARSLEKRASIARQYNTDLFVSIHVNSEKSKKAHGMETYFLDNSSSQTYSHHKTLQKRDRKRRYRKHDPDGLSMLMRSVATDSTVTPSLNAARYISASVGSQLRKDKISIKNRGVRKQLFQVLLDARVPGLLFEAAYLSHPQDVMYLTSNRALDSIARGLAGGIARFLASK